MTDKPRVRLWQNEGGKCVRVDFSNGESYGITATKGVPEAKLVQAVELLLKGRKPFPGVYETCVISYSPMEGFNVFRL